MKRWMRRMVICLLLTALCLPACAMAAKSRQMEDDVPEWAEESVRQYAVDYIGGKDMSRLWGYYDLQIRRYMPLSAFENFLSSLEWMTGEFYETGSYSSFAEPELELKTHVLHLCMERQDMDMYLTHKNKDDDWEVMALQFVPSEKQDRPSGLDMLVDNSHEAAVEKAEAYTETDVIVGTDSKPLKGILTMPAGAGQPVPACVLVHDRGALGMNGSEATSFFAEMAHSLADMGIASIRYDKRTYAYGRDGDMTAWEETVEDAILAGKLLKNNVGVDSSRLVVIGHGLGAMLAPRIVSQARDVFTGMVLIGGTPQSYAQLLLNECDPSACSAEQFDELQQTIDNLPGLKEKEARELTLFERNGYYFWEMEQYNAVELIKKQKIKTYIVQGSRDEVVSEDEGWRLYSEEIGDGITFVGFKSFRGLDHELMSNQDGILAFDRAAGKNIGQWILSLNLVAEE